MILRNDTLLLLHPTITMDINSMIGYYRGRMYKNT
jgi:hypothetical protein